LKIQKGLLSKPLKILARINSAGEAPPRFKVGDSLAENLTLMLAPLIEKERVSIESISDRLAISRRSLQRQLEREGTSFSVVYERSLECRAIKKIRQPGASITRIGSELGYSDTSHFSRAFKRWTGQSPQAYRRAMMPSLGRAERSK
jgi:AraC-like DNA-binding protein